MHTFSEERKSEFMVLLLTVISTVLCVCSLYFPNWMLYSDQDSFDTRYYGLFRICTDRIGIDPLWICRTTSYINDSTRRLNDVYKVTGILWGMSNLLSIAATIMTMVSGQYWSRRNLYATACLSICTCLLALTTSIVFGVSHRNVGGTFDFAFYLGLCSIIINITTFLTTINKANDYEEDVCDDFDLTIDQGDSFDDSEKQKLRIIRDKITYDNTENKVWGETRNDNSDDDDREVEVILRKLVTRERGDKSSSNLTVPRIRLNGQDVSFTEYEGLRGNRLSYTEKPREDSDSDTYSSFTTSTLSTSNIGTPVHHSSFSGGSNRKLSTPDPRGLEAVKKHSMHSSTHSVYSVRSERCSVPGLLLGALSGSSLSCDRDNRHHRSAFHHRHAHFSRRHRPRYRRSMRRRRSH